MSIDTGNALLASIKSMRDFLGDVSLLLQTADKLVSGESWEPLYGSNALFGLSYSVASGNYWMPREAVRTYRNESRFPQVTIMVAVLLDDYEQEYKLTQPVVTASYFVMRQGKTSVDYWNCRWFGWRAADLAGTPVLVAKSDSRDWKESWGWDEMCVLGRPLVEVTDESKLKELIVDPLLKLIEARS